MRTPILVPEVGAGPAPIRVSCWLVEPGDAVEQGDRLVELLLPTVTFDVSAPVAGVLSYVEKAFDAVTEPGEVLGWIERTNAQENAQATWDTEP